MCEHARGDAEECLLTLDPAGTGRLVCRQAVDLPIPRQRTDGLDVLVPLLQADPTA